MTLGGLWHGAAMTFVAWGLYHGLLLCLLRPLDGAIRAVAAANPLGRLLAMLAMFHAACVGWLLFRADSIDAAVGIAWRLIGDGAGWASFFGNVDGDPLAWSALGLVAFFGAPLLVYDAWRAHRDDHDALLRAPWLARAIVYTYFVLMLWCFPPAERAVFLYFQF